MKFSFIIPIYNVENYLCKCLDSILAQTYKDYEIILIDDGSRDRSGEIADAYAEKYPEKIRVFHQKNGGQGEARNTGIAMARGKYLLMVDSDDYIAEWMLEVAEKYLDKYDDDILIFNFITEEINGTQHLESLHKVEKHTWISPKEYIFEAPAPWNKIFRASLFQGTNVRFPARIIYEDLATIPCLALWAKRIGVVKEAPYYYVQRASSTMHTSDTERMLEICTAVEKILDYFKKQNKFQDFYYELECLTVGNVLCSGIRRILNVKFEYSKVQKLEHFTRQNFPDYKQNPYLKKEMESPGFRRERWIITQKYFFLWGEYCLKRIKRIFLKGDALV